MNTNFTNEVAFGPFVFKSSKVLILGSFPSKKSREVQFYYGNKQNRFWPTVCGFFNEEVPLEISEKKDFLKRRKIALWDMVAQCDIKGSSDLSIKNAVVVDLDNIFKKANIERILLNGTLAYNLFLKKYENISIPYFKLPSTSPANTRFDKSIWEEALSVLR